MALPRVVEYLLTLRRESGGLLVMQGASQTIIPAVVPGQQFVLQAFPIGTDYLNIVYSSQIDPAVVPGVFFAWGQYYGNRAYEGRMMSYWTANQLDSFVFISENEPAWALIRNLSPVNQYYSGVAFFITIASEDDYIAILDALKKNGSLDALAFRNMLRRVGD